MYYKNRRRNFVRLSDKSLRKKALFLTITLTSSNFFIGVKDIQSHTLKFYSAGTLGFKNKRKKTNYTFNYALRLFLNEIKLQYPDCLLNITFKGFVKPIHVNSLKNLLMELKMGIYSVRIDTKFAHNGVKSKKIRRV